MHNYLTGKGSNYKAALHTHPIDLVAMTHNPAFLKKDVLTYLLWSMIPETRAFCPRGLGIIPYAVPGSFKLADATIMELDEFVRVEGKIIPCNILYLCYGISTKAKGKESCQRSN